MTFADVNSFCRVERNTAKHSYECKKGRGYSKSRKTVSVAHDGHVEAKIQHDKVISKVDIESTNKLMHAIERELNNKPAKAKPNTLARPEDHGFTEGSLYPASHVRSGFNNVMTEIYHKPIIVQVIDSNPAHNVVHARRPKSPATAKKVKVSSRARGNITQHVEFEERVINELDENANSKCNADFMGL